MPDIRDVLKGLSPDDRALYTEVRTTMRRAYLYAHSKILPIEQYDEPDDHFLDMIDIKIATLFDRAGTFNHAEGSLDTEQGDNLVKKLEEDGASAATRMMRDGISNQARAQAWPDKRN